jgi:hypothetical protein
MEWFNVDKTGLRRLLERRGKEFVVYEPIQNAWDQHVTRVDVTLAKEPHARCAVLRVEDDDPNGFSNLTHAFTLFAESEKKANANQRGRFNFGEKLVLAMCDEAEIQTTTGGVRFDAQGRHLLRKKRNRGSIFEGRLKLTNKELEACCAAVFRLIPPPGIITTFNGTELRAREPVAVFEATLKTEISDEEGNLRPTTRKTNVHLYEPVGVEVGTLYEMGIPVVETGDSYHCDVQQKVPVSLDRANVAPGYLRTLRTLVLNQTFTHLDTDQANTRWVKDALSDPHVSEDAIRAVIERRFGTKAVVYDPSDQEANKIAGHRGYTVVTGSQLGKEEWENVRRVGVLKPAGQVTPSEKPFHPDGKPLATVAPENWSEVETATVATIKRISIALLGYAVEVIIADDFGWSFDGAYENGKLYINKPRLGNKFFAAVLCESALSFLIHEFAHEHAGDHLSHEYHEAACRLGARLVVAVANDPSLIDSDHTVMSGTPCPEKPIKSDD